MLILIRKKHSKRVLKDLIAVQYQQQGVVAESVVAWELAHALVEQFGKDRMELIQQNITQHNNTQKNFNKKGGFNTCK